jgi:hypothetical protein
VQKVPSYLKGLAETRARAAGDIQRYQQVLVEVTASLTKAQAELAACDTLICKFDERLDPNQIAPIKAWQGRYGKRGALRAAIVELLQERAPAPVTTTEVGWQMQLKFGIAFAHWTERKAWMGNSIKNCLTKLSDKENLVEACHLAIPGGNGRTGSWRWKAPIDSLEGLVATATSAGVKTTEATDFVPDEEPAEAEELPS